MVAGGDAGVVISEAGVVDASGATFAMAVIAAGGANVEGNTIGENEAILAAVPAEWASISELPAGVALPAIKAGSGSHGNWIGTDACPWGSSDAVHTLEPL